MDNSFDKVMGQIKDMSELSAYAQSQYNTIIKLNKKITQLEQERNHLQELLQSTAPVIVKSENGEGLPNLSLLGEHPSYIICEMELAKLKAISDERILTLEEVKKYDILTKNLLALQAKREKKEENSLQDSPVEDLLKLVE